MLDIKFIRENQELVKEAARKKRMDFDVAKLIAADDERKKLLQNIEGKRAEQNEFSKKIVNATPDERTHILEQTKKIKEDLEKEEEKLKEVMKNWQVLMLCVPNIPDMTVPEGDDDSANQEIKKWGEMPKFDFTPKEHIDLMLALDMADFDRGAKSSGFRGYFLKNDGVLLSFALWQLTLEMMRKRGFLPMLVPSLANKEIFYGTGYLPGGEEDLYKVGENQYLAGTGEVATMGYFSDEIIAKEKLPMKILAFSPCFRREAGSHGKDTKGLIRVHEFFKWEQVVLCEASHEESVKFHEEIRQNAEDILQALEVPYRVVINCGGDLGLGQVKKYDIEAWVPSEGKYRETHSASYFHDFQTRRLNIRYKDADGKTRFVHSLNNTALATPRTLVSIVENFQQKDGSIKIPAVLQKYIGKEVIDK
ncbi:serine--tRNA ligase [bacterium]|nr:serine--tRNA ligase [bacterium]